MDSKQLKAFLTVCVASLCMATSVQVKAETKFSGSVYYNTPSTSVRVSSGKDRVFMYNGCEQRHYRPHGDRYGWTKPYRPSHQQYNNNYNYRNSCKVKYVKRYGNTTEIYCE